MTEQTNAMLIAELRAFAAGSESARATLMRDAADALEAAEQGWDADVQRLAEAHSARLTAEQWAAELAAVVEKARAEVEGESGWFRHRAGRVLDILATSPADALREVKADVWASGYNAGYSDRSTPGETFTRNPYKAREERA